ncbi:hypothetical protein O181_107588 [Austropuccinia psidii MF-1]|uniref:Uncharacterized protein n=1 Tax=Austropuccinia psidii MF-1 TaxID=1389203 RepID=A0A9Q3PN11_9BASI|nr:hypothetical protein [Austropuccinia psidii MF-1]
MLNVERPYPPLLRRPSYPDSARAREALEIPINELMKLGVLRNVGHNEEVEVTTPLIIPLTKKILQVNMKISLKKCNIGFHELKALGLVVSGLSPVVHKNKVASVLLKPIPQNKKEMMSF